MSNAEINWSHRLRMLGLLGIACCGTFSLGCDSSQAAADPEVTIKASPLESPSTDKAKESPKPIPQPATFAKGPTGYGTFIGQIVFDGEIPVILPLVKKGDFVTAKDAECCTTDIPDERLVIDSQTRGIRNVFVYFMKAARIHPDLQKSTLAEVPVRAEGCRYVPHATLVRTDQIVLFTVVDSNGHSAHAYPTRNPSYCSAIMPGATAKLSYKQAERLPMPVMCDIHPWMKCWWLVLDHPYAAITDAKGQFRIEKLPAGDYQFVIWHESSGYLNKQLDVTIHADQTTEMDTLKVAANRFKLR